MGRGRKKFGGREEVRKALMMGGGSTIF